MSFLNQVTHLKMKPSVNKQAINLCNVIMQCILTHPTKSRSISRLAQHSTKVEPTTHSGSPRSSHDSLSGMLRSNL
ncbi:hypothetical protein GQ457_07G002570 [Hibiscus cannabinus]